MLEKNIKRFRQNRSWSQEELGYRINTTRQTISKWEKGLSVPDASMLIELAEVFECSTSDLLGTRDTSFNENDDDSIASKLENLNIILARRNERWSRFWKRFWRFVIIALVVLAIISLLSTAAYYR